MDADPSYTLASRVVAAPDPAIGAAVRQLTSDWLAQTRKGCFGSGYWSFYVPAGALFLFLPASWGCVSTLSGLRCILFAFILSGSPPPSYHPAIGLHRSPPREVRLGLEPVPFRVCANQSNAS